MSKSKELTNTGLFVMFVLIPAFPIFGIFISTIDDVAGPINFFIFTMSVLMLLSWFIVMCTQFCYRKPKNKPTKF